MTIGSSSAAAVNLDADSRSLPVYVENRRRTPMRMAKRLKTNPAEKKKKKKKQQQEEEEAKRGGKKTSVDNNNQAKRSSNYPPKQMAPRKILALGNGPVKLDLDKMLPCNIDQLKVLATFGMKDHFIRKSENWRAWRVTKIVKAVRRRVSGYNYYLTFQAQNADDLERQQMTFEAHIWDNVSERRVNRVRTLSPIESEWESGNLWIPSHYEAFVRFEKHLEKH